MMPYDALRDPWLTRPMRNPLAVVTGIVLVLAGSLFTLQGLGYVGGSPMSDVDFWAIAGPAIAGLGVALVIVGLRGNGR